jgi:TIR domain
MGDTVYKIFISYSTKDSQWSDAFASYLKNRLEPFNCDIWYTPKTIRTGQNWMKKLEKEIIDCDCFLLLISPNSIRSRWVEYEYRLAMIREKRIYGILIKPCNPHGFLEVIQNLNATANMSYETAALNFIKDNSVDFPELKKANDLVSIPFLEYCQIDAMPVPVGYSDEYDEVFEDVCYTPYYYDSFFAERGKEVTVKGKDITDNHEDTITQLLKSDE